MKGINHPMYGKKHTKKSLLKMSEVHKGHIHSEEQKSKISIANKGKKRTPEQIRNYINAWKIRRLKCAV